MGIKANLFWAMIGAAFLTAALLHFQSPNIPEPDALYYMRQAWLHRTSYSLWDTSFPWLPYSSVRLFGSDIWYGAIVLLVPFTYFADLFLAVKIVGFIFTALFLISCFYILARHMVRLKFFWPFLALLAVPNALFQFLMMRPQILSLSLSVLLFSFLAVGAWWQVFLVSLGITFLHLSFFWIEILILLVFIGFCLSRRKERFDWIKILAVIGGGVAGWFLRPHPIAAAKLLYAQVFKLLIEKQGEFPLLFGGEWYPYSLSALIRTSAFFLIIWGMAIGFLVFLLYKNRSLILGFNFEKAFLLWGSFIISAVFFLLTYLVARRSQMLWVTFGVVFIACFYSYVLDKRFHKEFFASVLAIIFLLATPFSLYRNSLDLASAVKPDRLKDAALWLRDNSNPGDIVFNTHWDSFSALFFWNQKNYYVGGLDPIFQYDYNPSLYWKFHFLSNNQADVVTCSDAACRREGLRPTYEVLVKDFNAKYVFIEKRRNPKLYNFLEQDARFEERFTNGKETVFLVKR